MEKDSINLIIDLVAQIIKEYLEKQGRDEPSGT